MLPARPSIPAGHAYYFLFCCPDHGESGSRCRLCGTYNTKFCPFICGIQVYRSRHPTRSFSAPPILCCWSCSAKAGNWLIWNGLVSRRVICWRLIVLPCPLSPVYLRRWKLQQEHHGRKVGYPLPHHPYTSPPTNRKEGMYFLVKKTNGVHAKLCQ